ncbi:hypothetical protein QUA62_12160 [Microcoleus sp. MON1_C1]|uniref:hypothetical protein n=1 Tax=Microcoleus sp. MON1_C1 TaxID=2818827 RepID=UPI002FD26EE7
MIDLQNFLNSLNCLGSDGELIDYCRKYVLHGTPYIFINREDEYYDFRKRIATNFNISFNEVFITGSAKLGFSPRKEKQFDYDSDIDVAIVSNFLYEEIMESIRCYQMELRKSRRSITTQEMQMYHKFLEYVAIGWIRPDKLPTSFKIQDMKNNWFAFFQSISHNKSEVGNYKVSAGVFKSYLCFENYTISGFKDLKTSLNIGVKNAKTN